MCTTCGCGGQVDVPSDHVHESPAHDHDHHGHDHHGHDHHDHDHHDHDHHDHAHGPLGAPESAGVSPAPRGRAGSSETATAARLIRLERDILEVNDRAALRNRERFAAAGVLALNLVSSPGAGKTTLLVETIASGRFPVAVVEGDQQTSLDADRIRTAGAPAFQVNTGRACHLDAHMVGHAADHLALPRDGILFVENVGNLVCPAAFDLGEAARILLVSVTEGDDKPLKYPDIFHGASLVVVTKIDLLPYVGFDLEACLDRARRLNPAAMTLALSATTGEGMDAWFGWLAKRLAGIKSPAAPGV